MKSNKTQAFFFSEIIDWKPLLFLVAIFYFFFLILTPLGTDISFLPASQEPRGVYHLLHMDEGDDAGHFAYLRSLFFDHDIDFFNEPYYAHHRTVLHTGYVVNQWKVGPAILWFPFFLLAHGVTWIYNLLGSPLSRDGLSFVYLSSTALGSATYVLLGLILNYSILRRWFSQLAAFSSVVLFFLTTGLIYFTFIRSRMAHANDYFLICFFIRTWLSFRESPSNIKAVLTGLVGGLMILTRINSIGYLLLPFYDLLKTYFTNNRASRAINVKTWKSYSLLWCCVLLVFSLQMNINQILTGSWSPIPQTGDQKVQLFSPENWSQVFIHLFHLTLGENWGILWHAPIYLIGATGFFLFIKTNVKIRIPFLLALLAPLILVIIWPHHGLSYGNRHLLTLNFLFSIGFAYLFDRWSSQIKVVIFGLGGLILIVWSYFQLCLFKIVVPHDSTAFAWQAFRSIRLFWEVPRLWSRGENFFFIFSQPSFELQTTLDWYLLVIYPALQAIILIILLFTGVYIWDKIRAGARFKSRALSSINLLIALFIIFLHIMIQVQSDKRSPEFIYKRKSAVMRQYSLPLTENRKRNIQPQKVS